MDASVLIQLIVTVGAIISGMMLTIRYAIKESGKKDKVLLEYIEKQAALQLEYNTTKNGHMERMAKQFTVASNKMSEAINRMSTKLEVLEYTHK